MWKCKWFERRSSRELIEEPPNKDEETMKVREIRGNGWWDWSKISFEIPKNIRDIISGVVHCNMQQMH